MDVLKDKVLVLNRRFYPLCVTSVEGAFHLLFKEKAVVMDNCWVSFSLDEYSKTFFHKLDRAVRTTRRVYIAPEVIRLLDHDKVYNRTINLTSQNIFMRDSFECQYCRSTQELTLDHVIPKSRAKEFKLKFHSSWENLVTSCYECNNTKADRTPDEAGMVLLCKPQRPTSSLKFKFGKGGWKPSWNTYLGQDKA